MIKIGIYDEKECEFRETHQYMAALSRGKELRIVKVEIANLLLAIEEQTFDFHILITEVISKDTDILRLVKEINRKFPDCQIIYLTNQIEYVSRVYETEHCYFILKKELMQVMPKALDKALETIRKTGCQYLKVVSERKQIEIPVSQIYYIERFQHQCRIVTFNEKYLSYISLKQLMERLPEYFIRCHTGYLVNGKCIEKMSGTQIVLEKRNTEGQMLPVGRNFRNGVKRYLSGRE